MRRDILSIFMIKKDEGRKKLGGYEKRYNIVGNPRDHFLRVITHGLFSVISDSVRISLDII